MPPRAAALCLAAALALSAVVAPNASTTPAACADPRTRYCSAPCDACCADFTVSECGACIRARCEAPHRCVDAGAEAPCTVCEGCCQPYLSTQHACDACVNSTCAAEGGDDGSAQCASHGTKAHPVQCDLECVEGCFWPPA